ncbi:MAG TPA: DUF4912 domain-containing protein, partial [Phormidium sp.]
MTKERPPLEDMTLRQLRKVASEYGISRYSRMRKSQLLAAILDVQHLQVQEESPAQPKITTMEVREVVEAAKYHLGKYDLGEEDISDITLSTVDDGLADLPAGYGECRIVLMPRDPQWAYAYWDLPNEAKEELRRQGGQQLALRLYDVTDISLNYQSPHSIQEYPCDELAREWYLPIPVSDRDYVVEIGYRRADGYWLLLARSTSIRIPPIYPSDWVEDQFITVSWDEELKGKTFFELVPPDKRMAEVASIATKEIFELAEEAEAQRIAGSVFGSMQQVPGSMQPVSSYSVSSYAVSSHEQAVSSYSLSSYSLQLSSFAVSSYVPAVSSFSVSSYSVPLSSYAMSSYAVSSYAVSSYAMSSYAVSSYAVSSYAVSSYAISSYAVSSYEQAMSSYAVSSFALPLSSYAVSSFGVSSYEQAVSSYAVSSFGLSSYEQAMSSYAVSSFGLSSFGVSSYEQGVSSYAVSSYQIPLSSYAISSFGVSSYEQAISSYALSSYAVSSY